MYALSFKDLPYKTKWERKATDVFEALIKISLDKHHRISRKRARGPRKAHAIADGLHPRAYDQHLPIRHAETVTIYIELKEKYAAKTRADSITLYGLNNMVKRIIAKG